MGEASLEFPIGQIVCLKSNPAIRGPIIGVLQSSHENRFKVFIQNETQVYYASQLTADQASTHEIRTLDYDAFRAYLTSLQILYPGHSALYSLNTARVDFIPYQFRPVLKFLQSDMPRMLIADSVGVGKTIEAGLILKELQARRAIESILIICPRALVAERKWEIEMKRFDEPFQPLDGKTLRYCLNSMDLEGEWPESHRRSILPYSLFDETLLYGPNEHRRKQKKGLLHLDPPPHFDLVIVDEAHHIRNQSTLTHAGVRFFCDHAEAVLFLTATPIQLGSHDLFVLLNVLRPDLIIDQESFAHMAEPNPWINKAVETLRSQSPVWKTQACEALDQAGATPWGRRFLIHNPKFQEIQQQLKNPEILPEEKIKLISDTEALYTFSGMINRTRRRDIGDFTIRKPETVTVSFTPQQKRLHDDLLATQAKILQMCVGNISVQFMMSTLMRQAASCLHGLVPMLGTILNRRMDALYLDMEDDQAEIPGDQVIQSIQTEIQAILEQGKNLADEDPKLQSLIAILHHKQSQPNNKTMVFSTFRHTLKYLYQHLNACDFRLGLIHGGIHDEERLELRKRFQMPRENPVSIDTLLFSEVGSEGLDYQFCDCIVNYDLPWNPMRIEQRIGRIDRKGQKSESIAIFNMITPGTIDAEIYERCLLRLGIFNQALGGSEEILGEIGQEIKDIAENYMLTEEERKSRLQQLADNKIRLIREQEELEERQRDLFGIHLPEEEMKKDIEKASSFWLSQDSVYRMVLLYLRKKIGKDPEFFLGEKPLKTLRLGQEGRNHLLEDFLSLSKTQSKVYREWERWLKGPEPYLSVTFDQACASDNPESSFIMPLHPLARQAAQYFGTKEPAMVFLTSQTDHVEKGEYPFAVYLWKLMGIKEDLLLHPVALSDKLSPHLKHLMENAIDDYDHSQKVLPSETLESLDKHHHIQWSTALESHRQQTKDLASYRKESLTRNHRSRIAILEDQYLRVSEEKIKRMRKSQIGTAQADYDRRIQALDRAAESADIITEPVAYGWIRIT